MKTTCQSYWKYFCFICRYLALESMCLLATSEFSHEAVKKHQETVVNSLKVCALRSKSIFKRIYLHCTARQSLQTERDVSVRQRAVDLLYAMCDRSNAEEIVSEMLGYLETADYSIREEMVRNFFPDLLYVYDN